MEIVVYTREVKGRRWNRSGGSDLDIGGLDWIGHYKVMNICQDLFKCTLETAAFDAMSVKLQ